VLYNDGRIKGKYSLRSEYKIFWEFLKAQLDWGLGTKVQEAVLTRGLGGTSLNNEINKQING
jgi:hypothetical protein